MIDDIKQIAQQIADEITQIEARERKRNTEAQAHFEYAIASIVQEVWKGTKNIMIKIKFVIFVTTILSYVS